MADEYEDVIDFFCEIEGVSKRTLNVVPKNTLFAIKKKIDDDYVLRAEVDKNYTLNSDIPETPAPLDESIPIECPSCRNINWNVVYNSNRVSIAVTHCMFCQENLIKEPEPVIIKKYILRPKTTKKITKYKSRVAKYEPRS